MIIYFNALGVITSTDTTDEAIRQGSVGNTIKAYFAGKNNNNYTAKLNFTRPDGTNLTNLVMTPSPTSSTLFTFVLNDEWYLAIDGNASLTIFLYDGNGVIQAQGQVTFAIQDTDYDDDPDRPTTEQYDSLLSLVSQKNNVANSIVIVDNIDEVTLSNYSDGQLFYCKENGTYYQFDENGQTYVKVENGNGILASKRTMVRFYGDFAQNTLQSLFDKMGHRVFIMSQNGTLDYLIHFQIYNNQVYATRAVRLYDLRSWYATVEQLPLSNYLSALINNTYDDRMLHLNNYKDYAVPYSGATDDVELGDHGVAAIAFNVRSSTKGTLGGLREYQHFENGNFDLSLFADWGRLILGADGGVVYGDSEVANKTWTNNAIASAVAAVKANAFIVVDTEAYPTLDDFLDDYPAEEGYIYLYPSEVEEEGYLEYIYEGTQWLQIGTTQLDLSNYYNKDEVDDIANGVKADVPKHQVETIFIVDALTNINGRAFQNYTSTEVTIGGYTGLKILKNGNKVTEQEAKEYMEYMTGSFYLPKYNYDKPKNTYFITPAGHLYKPQYDSTNGLVLYDFGDLASKAYADTKVDKRTTEGIFAYVHVGSTQNELPIATPATGGTIAKRESDGRLKVAAPSNDGDATTKKYVDDSISNAISAVYRYKGTKTCAQINALTGMVTGDVYNVSDSGTLTEGSIQVRAGDNVAWTGSAWDKLAEDIDWDSYNETFLAAGFLQASEIDSVPENLTFDSEGNITNPDWTGNIALDYMSPPISDISISDVPATLTFDVTQDYDNMITNADWTGIMTITY